MEDLSILKEQANNISLKPVFSSNVKGIGYDKDTEIMVVIFKNGSKYAYYDVEESIYNAITNSESVGSALNECIVRNKFKVYKYFKI